MLDEWSKVDAVEFFSGVIEDSVVDIIDGCGKLVRDDGEDKFVCGPCLVCNDDVVVQFLRWGAVAPFGMTGYAGGLLVGMVNVFHLSTEKHIAP